MNSLVKIPETCLNLCLKCFLSELWEEKWAELVENFVLDLKNKWGINRTGSRCVFIDLRRLEKKICTD